MPIDINQQLRHVPFRIVQELVFCLEPPSNKDWLALIRAMPDNRFSTRQVNMMKVDGSRQCNTCTEVLWRELSHLCVTVKELGMYLKKIENYDALIALDWPHEPVEITSQPTAMVLKEGQDLCLRVTAIGYPLPVYQWYKNDELIKGEGAYELRIVGVSTANSGKYKCVATNEENSCTSNHATVQVMKKVAPIQPTPIAKPKPVIITHPCSQHVLAGNHHTLHCEVLGKELEAMKYLWYKDGQPLLNSNSPHLHIRLFGERDIGQYVCEVTNSYGNDISDVAELTIGQIGREIRHEPTDKVALLIGNQDYTANFPQGFQGQGTLRHTIADTKTLGSLLHSEHMGFNVLSFGNLSRKEMQKAVEEFLRLLSEDCYVVVYFAGHGFEVNGKHYLVPVDSPANWTQQDAICIQEILEAIWKYRPKLTVILLDMCRVRPAEGTKPIFEEYDFPRDLKIVMGFATCSQSESYERVDEDNGIYMKYLKEHICRDVKIEDVLHDVTTEVEAETSRCRFTAHQRPEYVSNGGGYFSLRDPVKPRGNTSAEKWLEAHKLPGRRLLEFDKGVKVEIRFEHSNWLTNTINIVVGVVDPGVTDHSYAYIYQLPNVEGTLGPAGSSPENRQSHLPDDLPDDLHPEIQLSQKHIDKPCARSWPQPSPQPIETEISEITEMLHLQRLFGNLPVTIALVSHVRGEKTSEYKVEVFSANEFGLAQVFQDS